MDGDVSSISKNPSLTFISTLINRHPVQVLLDTGASRSFIRASTLTNCRLRLSDKTSQTFLAC